MFPNEFEKSILSITEQRDLLLKEVGQLNVAKGTLLDKNRELTMSNSGIVSDINFNKGSLFEIIKKENERSILISIELFDLELKKSNLQNDVLSLEKEYLLLLQMVTTLNETISNLNSAYQYTVQQSQGLNELIKNTVRINTENTNDVNHLISKLRNTLLT